MSEEIKGVDTILGLAGSPSKVIEIERKLISQADSLMNKWNHAFLAFLPYCYVCHEPLNWYTPPTEEGHVFHCPKCDRKWKVKKSSDDKT